MPRALNRALNRTRKRHRKRRTWAFLGAAAAALLSWLIVPGTTLDRAAFTTVARASANPPFFITGAGHPSSPWSLRTLACRSLNDPRQAPVIVSLGDDPAGFFQSCPPAPIDLAVILTNLQRLGARRTATAAVLAWDAPDPIGLAALDQAMARFDSLVMAAPLSRGAVPEPMPVAFRNASLPITALHGNLDALPVVNRIPLPGVILGGGHTLAGFQVLDSEPAGKFMPLLARWEDRVVFAFPLLTVIQHLGLTTADVAIHPGEFLKIGPNGPTIPIDRYGRLLLPVMAVAPRCLLAAETLIDSRDDLSPDHALTPVVLRDDRNAAEPSTRAFSRHLPAVIATLAAGTGLTPARAYLRLLPVLELSLLATLAIALAALSGLPTLPRHLAFLSIATICLIAQCAAASSAQLWLPGVPALAAILAATLVAAILPAHARHTPT